MDDRFRFKTINIRTKEVSYVDSLYWFEENGVSSIEDGIGKGSYDDYHILQCTGLKDKNGKLIYEGDIITVANGSINGNVFTSNWEVVWEEENGKYRVPSWISDKPDFSHFVVVIGNIHENPELFEGQK